MVHARAADPQAPSAAYYRFRAHPHDYVSWLDVPSLPKLDHSSDALRDALYRGRDSVVGRWLPTRWPWTAGASTWPT